MNIKKTYIRIINALIYKVFVHFPYSKVRIWALRQLGYSVGDNVYFPADLVITMNFEDDHGILYIGNRVSIGPNVILLPVSHANASSVRAKMSKGRARRGIRIEDDAWIGAGAIILSDITIGAGAVVGAGSVVTKDVPSGVVVVGNPANILRSIE